MRVGTLAIGVIAVLTAAGIGGRYWVNGHLNAWFCLLSLFFSTNLLICYCETCLFRQLDYIRQRAEYWRQRREETGRSPVVEFLATEVPLTKILSPRYGRMCGRSIPCTTGHTPIGARTASISILPMAFSRRCQRWPCMRPLRSLFAGAFRRHSRGHAVLAMGVCHLCIHNELFCGRTAQADQPGRCGHVYLGIKCHLVLFPLLGLYVSIRLIVDGDYSVLGYR